MSKNKNLIWTGVLAAIGSSLCCITPLLAFISGATGFASTFSWIAPFRPYLIGMTFLVLGFAWYQKLKSQKEITCECDEDRPSVFQSKAYLVIMTIFAMLMLAFPYFSESLYGAPSEQITLVDKANIHQINLSVDGMTCASCESHINHAVRELEGISNIQVSFELGNATIEFDQTKTSKEEIEAAINSTGYVVKNKTKK